MALLRLLLYAVAGFHLTSGKELLIKVQNEQKSLEEMIYPPISTGLNYLYSELALITSTAEESSGHFKELIKLYTFSINSIVTDLTRTFQESGIDVSLCQQGLQDNVNEIETIGLHGLEEETTTVRPNGQSIISSVLPTLAAAQNRTLAHRLSVQDCVDVDLDLENEKECLTKALNEIEVKKNTLPLAIDVVLSQGYGKLEILKRKVNSDFQRIADGVSSQYSDILDKMLTCII